MTNLVIPMHAQVSGHFKLEAVRPNGDRRVLADWFANVITDNGLENLGSGSQGYSLTYCHVGTGSTAPAFTDTQLVSWTACNSSKVGDSFHDGSPFGAQATDPYYGWKRGTYRFNAGVATGNLSEVGLGPANTNINLFCRSLIKDTLGNPTTITVLSDEMLDVTYELRMYPPLADSNFNVTISGVNYAFTVRAAKVTNGQSWGQLAGHTAGLHNNGTYGTSTYVTAFRSDAVLQAITQGLGGTINDSTNSLIGGTNSPYAAGTKYRDFVSGWDINVATHAGGVGGFELRTTKGTYQVTVSPVLPKNNTNNLQVTFRVSWARYVI